MQKILNKIIITGDACRGKSALATKMADKLGIPHYSTDDYFYEVKFTKIRDRQESIEQISKVYENQKWIVEGTTERLIAPGLDSADLIIHLQFKNIFYQWVLLLRRHLGRGNESFIGILELLRHAFYKRYSLGYRKGKVTVGEFIAPYKNKTITLSSFKEIDNFIKTL